MSDAEDIDVLAGEYVLGGKRVSEFEGDELADGQVFYRKTGDGWQTRMDVALQDWLKKHNPAA